MYCTVVSDILTTDRIKLRTFVGHNNLSGLPNIPVVGPQTILDMSNILVKNPVFIDWLATSDVQGVIFSQQEPEKI